MYFIKKDGTRRSKAGIAGMIILFFFVVFVWLGGIFYVFSMMLSPLISAGYGWLYYSMFGMLALFMGVFGSVFSTYSMLYMAKDNELLLSMPIPPSVLLTVRIAFVYLMSLLFSAIVWIPGVIRYMIVGKNISIASVVCPVLLLFVLSLFVTVLCCLLGWVVALIAGKLKNKSIVIVILTVICIGVYYYVYFKINELLQEIVTRADEASSFFKTWVYPITQLGYGSIGRIVPFLIFTGISVLLFALCCFILAKSFNGIVTRSDSGKKAEYHETRAKVASLQKALLRKEVKKYLSSPTYLLNTGLGKLLMVIAAVAALIKRSTVTSVFAVVGQLGGNTGNMIPVGIVMMCFMILSMDNICAPSISIEGKNFYILQFLPIDPAEIIKAKERFQLYANTVPAVLFTATLGYIAGLEVTTIVLMCACAVIYVAFNANTGLALNILKPNFNWTNEAVPIKQSMPVTISMLGGWAFSVMIGAGYYLLRDTVKYDVYLAALLIVLAVVTILIKNWLKGKGAERLRYLQ